MGPGGSLDPHASVVTFGSSILQTWLGETAARDLFDRLGIAVHPCVLDTDSILPLISWAVRNHSIPRLLSAARLGGARLFASVTVRKEVPEKIVEKCPREIHVDPSAALQIWYRDFVPAIIFLDPSDLPPLSARVEAVARADRDDVLTAQLIEWLQPDAIYSSNRRHLGAFGILGPANADVSVALFHTSKRGAVLVGAHVGGGVAISISEGTVQSIASAVARMDRRISGAIALVIVVALVAAILHPRSRQWLHERATSAIEFAGRVCEAVGEIEANARQAEQVLLSKQRTVIEMAGPHLAWRDAGLVLAHAEGPLTVRELTARMIDEVGYQPRSAQPERYVAQVLRQHPEHFHRALDNRWQLGPGVIS